MSHTTKLVGNWIAIHDQTPNNRSDVIFRKLGDRHEGDDLVIPYGVLFDFIAEQVRANRIHQLEDANARDILA